MKFSRSTSDPTRQAHWMGGLLIVTGILHFVTPRGFDSIIPKEIPVPARTLTYASGVAELVIGAGLIAPRTRKASALAAAALFVAVFPANVNTVRIFKDRPVGYRVAAIARLPLQVPLITTAWQIFTRSA